MSYVTLPSGLRVWTPYEGSELDIREQVRETGKQSLYFFLKAICGMDRLKKHLHLQFCNFVQLTPQSCGIPHSRRKLGIMPREHFKSTIVSVGDSLHKLVKNQEATIALISAKVENPVKWLRQIAYIITENEWFQWVYPEIKPGDKWAETELSIRRPKSLSGTPQASITAASIMQGQASQHYGHIKLDDPVNEKIADSPKDLEKAVERCDYLEYLLQDWETSTFDFVGTPYGRGDAIQHYFENDIKLGHMLYWSIGALGEFDCSEEVKKMPECIPQVKEGEPILPTECPWDRLNLVKKRSPRKYYLQYLCKLFEPGRNGFHLDLIRDTVLLADGATIKCDCHRTHNHVLDNCAVAAVWDPAVTDDKENCRNAIGVIAQAPCGCRFLLDEWADWVEPDQAVEKLTEICVKWQPFVRALGIEIAGQQRFAKGWVEMLQREGKFPPNISIIDLNPRGREKNARIKSQQIPVANGVWHIRPFMVQSKTKKNTLWELAGWPFLSERDLIDVIFGYCEDVFADPAVQVSTNREEVAELAKLNAYTAQRGLSRLAEDR